MDKIKRFWHEHPYMIAALVFLIGAILLWYFLRGRSGSTSVDNSGYYAAQGAAIASSNQLAEAQISAQVASQQIQGAIATNASNNQTLITKSQIEADSTKAITQIAADEAVKTATISGTVATTLAGYGADTQQKQDMLAFGSLNLSNSLAAKVAEYTAQENSYNNAVTQLADAGKTLWGSAITGIASVANNSLVALGPTNNISTPSYGESLQYAGAQQGYQQIAAIIGGLQQSRYAAGVIGGSNV